MHAEASRKAPSRDIDLSKLRGLDLEGMLVLRVLPNYGEAAGEIVSKLQVVGVFLFACADAMPLRVMIGWCTAVQLS